MYAGMDTNGQDATTTSNHYGVHSTTIRSSNETLITKRQQAAERQRLYRDRKRQVSNNEETLKKRQQAAEQQRLYRDRNTTHTHTHTHTHTTMNITKHNLISKSVYRFRANCYINV
jgi:dipeptidyl aminopeptidase/acylaminoacyl peptidase